jgi:hypothetical protein
LISVKVSTNADDMDEALQFILADIKANPGREKRSVVLTTEGNQYATTYAEAKADAEFQQWYARPIRAIQALGVPVVCAAGNYAKDSSRQMIDTVPAVLADDDTPLIVVGGATYDGDRYIESQYGPQITVYAPGENIEVQNEKDFEKTVMTGTSAGKCGSD